jgi:hypothetical protein
MGHALLKLVIMSAMIGQSCMKEIWLGFCSLRALPSKK